MSADDLTLDKIIRKLDFSGLIDIFDTISPKEGVEIVSTLCGEIPLSYLADHLEECSVCGDSEALRSMAVKFVYKGYIT